WRVPFLTHSEGDADYVIGTLARKSASDDLRVAIVTIDKDMFQLVNDRVSVLDTRTMTWFDSQKVQEKLGVPPEQVVELLGLWGDTSDNIPGAPGVGEKGALALIQQFGTVENCLANAAKISRKTYRESLQNNRELILQSRSLAEIYTDLPVALDLDLLRLEPPDRAACLQLFTELEFTTLIREFLPTAEVAASYRTIASRGDWEALCADIAAGGGVALAWAPDSADPITAGVGRLAVATAGSETALVDTEFLKQEPTILQSLLGDPRVQTVVHDLKPLLIAAGNNQCRVHSSVKDSMLSAYLVNPSQSNYGLGKLTLEYLQAEIPESSDEPLALCRRADLTGQLYRILAPEIAARGLESLLTDIEIPLIPVLAGMEQRGVGIDTSLLASMSAEMEKEVERLSLKIFELAGEQFNLNSPRQLGEILFEKLNLTSIRKTRKTKNYATGVEVLELLAEEHELPRLILEYRAVSKLKSTYVDSLPQLVHPRTGRLHTSYNQMVAATGRLSSSNPNLQNIPIKSELGRKIRKAFVPADGFRLLSADYSQVELRVMAHLSEDPVLIEAFGRGEDIHHRTALEVFGAEEVARRPHEARRLAKVFNFGIMYGLSAFGLARDLKMPQTQAQAYIDEYFRRYAGIKRWLDQTILEARNQGFVRTLFGRIRLVPDINARNWNLANFAERTAINAPIQGTAADLIKIAMIQIDAALCADRMQSRLILQVHDELVFEVRKGEEDQLTKLVRDRMENVYPLRVPLQVEVSVGDNWMK
ncbi:MAG: DNA polymerase I, partial [Acidobacteriota bacterium]